MRIHRIHLQHVAGVDDRELTFDDGVTVVVGPNEAGKSTIPTALKLLLEEKDRYDNADIRAVRPVHTDADPTIELECTTGPYHLTYRKVFGSTAKRRETTLQVHAPDPASLTGDAAHDRMCEILDETVDEDLWSALRVQQRHDVGQADLTASGALAAALDAAGTGASSLAEDETLVDRVDAAAAEFWTDTGRERKPLQQAGAAVEAAGAELEEAATELASIREATDRHDRLVAQLDDWRSALPGLEARAKETAETLEELDQQRTALKGADERLTGARTAATRARDDLADRQMQVERLDRLGEVAEQREEDLEHAREAAERAEQRATEARTERDAAREELDAARRALRAAEGDVRLLRLDADVEQFTARIEQAEQLHLRREDAKSRRDTDAPTAAVIRRLEKLAEDVRTAAAVLQADLPRVRVAGPEGTTVVLDDEELSLTDAGLERTVEGELALRVGEVSVTVAPGASATELADTHADAVHALETALEQAGVADVAAARARREADREAQRELEQTKDEWAQLTSVDGLDGLRSSRDRTAEQAQQLRADRPDDRPLPDTVAEAEQLVASHQAEVERLEGVVATADTALETATAAAGTARTAVAEARAKLDGTREQHDEVATALAAAREDTTDDELAAAVERAEQDVTAAEQAREQAEQRLGALNGDAIEADAETAETRLASTRERIKEADLDRAKLWGRIESSADAGLGEKVPQLEAALADAEAERDALRHRAEALKLLRDTLHEHRDAARARYQAPLKREVERLGRVVFGESFSVTLDEELRVVERTLDGRTLSLEQLSGGAQEQLAIITRLAAAALVDPDDGVPLILDDALGYADPARTDRVNALLADVGERAQVIVLTCDPDRFTGVRGARAVRVA